MTKKKVLDKLRNKQKSRTHLGASYTNFWASIDVNATVCFSGDGAAHSVGDADCQSSSLLTVAQSQQAVCRLSWTRTSEFRCLSFIINIIQLHTQTHKLTWLTDEKADIISEDWRVSIQEITGQLHHYRKFSQFFQYLTCLSRKQSQ